MKTKLSILLLALSLVLTACGGNEAKNKKSSDHGEAVKDSGEELAKQNCTGCHGTDLQGDSAPSLQKIGAKYSKKEIENIIKNGRGGMPKILSDDQKAAAIAKWLSTKK